jgi:hypothetical protein
MIGSRRLLAAMLLPAGIIVSHSAGYFAAGADPTARGHAVGLLHGDIGGLAVIAAAAVVAVLVLEARAGRSSDAPSPVPFTVLALGQGAAYALMELGERLAHGVSLGEALAEPTLRWGLAIQVVVAACACLLVRVTRVVARALDRRPPPTAALQRSPWPAGPEFAWCTILRSPCSRRGPPPLNLQP